MRVFAKFTKAFTIIALTITAVFSSLPAKAQSTAEPKACPKENEAIRFGAAVSLTGSLAREGEDTQQGYDTWADWVNKEVGGIKVGDKYHCVTIKYYDDESKAETVSLLTEKLITEDKIQFILGPYSSGLTASASVITERYKIIMVEANGAAESIFSKGFKYVFGVLTPGSFYTKAAIEKAYELGARSVVIGYEDTSFPTSVAKGAQKWAEGLGMKVLAFDNYPENVDDLTAMFTRFRDLKPDIFVGGGHFKDSVIFIKNAKSLNFSPKAFIMTVGPSNPQFAKELGADAENVWGVTQWEPSFAYKDDYFGTSQDYADRFMKRYPNDAGVNYQNAESTAAALVLHLAITGAGTLESAKVRDVLAVTDVMTFYGPIKFDETGKNAGKPMGAIQVQKGKNVPIVPESVRKLDIVWPATAWDKK